MLDKVLLDCIIVLLYVCRITQANTEEAGMCLLLKWLARIFFVFAIVTSIYPHTKEMYAPYLSIT